MFSFAEMESAEIKRCWKKFNQLVNDIARCVACKKRFEQEIYMCSESHNICHSCYSPCLEGSACGFESCVGWWLNANCRNLLLAKISQLRTSLYAARENITKLDSLDLPWEELFQCAICYEQFSKGVYMCQFGHNWCQVCQSFLMNLTQGQKCPFCNMMLTMSNFRNKGVEDIVKGLQVRGTREPIRRVGTYPCPIMGCTEFLYMRTMFVHLRTSHRDNYFILDKSGYAFKNMYKIATITYENYSAAVKVYGVGLFGCVITFEKHRKGVFIDQAYLYCLSAFHRTYEYTLQLRFLSKKNKTAASYRSGIMFSDDTQESVRLRNRHGRDFDVSMGIPIQRDSLIDVFFSVQV